MKIEGAGAATSSFLPAVLETVTNPTHAVGSEVLAADHGAEAVGEGSALKWCSVGLLVGAYFIRHLLAAGPALEHSTTMNAAEIIAEASRLLDSSGGKAMSRFLFGRRADIAGITHVTAPVLPLSETVSLMKLFGKYEPQSQWDRFGDNTMNALARGLIDLAASVTPDSLNSLVEVLRLLPPEDLFRQAVAKVLTRRVTDMSVTEFTLMVSAKVFQLEDLLTLIERFLPHMGSGDIATACQELTRCARLKRDDEKVQSAVRMLLQRAVAVTSDMFVSHVSSVLQMMHQFTAYDEGAVRALSERTTTMVALWKNGAYEQLFHSSACRRPDRMQMAWMRLMNAYTMSGKCEEGRQAVAALLREQGWLSAPMEQQSASTSSLSPRPKKTVTFTGVP